MDTDQEVPVVPVVTSVSDPRLKVAGVAAKAVGALGDALCGAGGVRVGKFVADELNW
jgi:hypothetical protein